MTAEEEVKIREMLIEIVSSRRRDPIQFITIIITALSTGIAIVGLMLILGDRFYASKSDIEIVKTKQEKALKDIDDLDHRTRTIEQKVK